MLSVMEPRYKPPNRHTVSNTLIPAVLEKEREKLQNDLRNATAVALTTDAWTSRTADSYLTVTCHFLKDWQLLSKVLQTEQFFGSHTGEHVGLELKSILAKWQITDKVSVITCDNAANMGVAVNVSGVSHKLGCFAHTLNLASNKALGIPALCKVLGKIRTVVVFFHKSCLGTECLKEKQRCLGLPQHKLIIDCKTRWNSTFNMLERFLHQRPAAIAALSDERLKRANNRSKVVAGLSDTEIEICEAFVDLMQVMVTATKVLSEEKSPTVGIVLPLLHKLRNHFTPIPTDSSFVTLLKQAIGSDLAVRYTDPSLNEFLQEASALDPRTKTKQCITEETWERISQRAYEAAEAGARVPLIKQEPDLPSHQAQPDLPAMPTVPTLLQEGQTQETIQTTTTVNSSDVKHKKTALETLFEDDVTITKVDPPKPLLQQVQAEVSKYREAPPIPMKDCALDFWRSQSMEYPFLAVLAQRFLCGLF